MKSTTLFKFLFCVFFIISTLSNTTNLFAVDSVVVQTFTWDSIICRQSTFKFPDKNEKFYKVIGRYNLKCDPKTQHDRYNCGEWDYHSYTRILNYPEPELLYKDTPFPTATFGNLLFPTGSKTLELTATKIMDKLVFKYCKSELSSSNEVKHTLSKNDTNIGSFANYQFFMRVTDLRNAGISANNKIGKMILSANIVDTIKNVIVRATHFDGGYLPEYQTKLAFDTFAILDKITPQDCIDGKITLNFTKDLVWNGNEGIVFEIICNPIANSANKFNGTLAVGNPRSYIGKPFNYAVFAGENAWVDVNFPNIASKLKEQFTIEGWVKINSADTIDGKLDNAVLFSIGDKFVVKLGDSSEVRTHIHIEKFNEENQRSNTRAACLEYDKWHHIAIVFNGKAETSPERLKVFVDGESKTMWYNYWGVNGSYTEHNDGYSYVHHSLDSTDAHFAIGRGGDYATEIAKNTKKNFKGLMSQIRVWNIARDTNNISNDRFLTDIETSHPNYNNLLINLTCKDSYATRNMTNNCSYNDAVGRVIGEIYFTSQANDIVIPYTLPRSFIPSFELATGDFTYKNMWDSIVTDVEQIPVSFVEFNTTKATYPAINQITYYCKPQQNVYDLSHNLIASVPVQGLEIQSVTAGAETYIYSKRVNTPWKIFEIGRYMTPYGIGGLPLMDDGFEWEYDYTDYMHLLRDSVIIAAHNMQELLDLKFVFYKGDPIREVISVTEPWGATQHSVRYKDLIDNKHFAEEREIPIDPNAKSVKLKTRITGHGMAGADGSGQIQCCEFYNNTHYLYVDTNGNGNLERLKTWRIWRSCTENPIYPQGGTWFYWREGWCPGDAVQEYEYELTPYVHNSSVKVQYGISPNAYQTRPITGDGYYTMGLQLIQYGASKYKNDLELKKVIHPSDKDVNSRFNPICNGIEFVVHNNSDTKITKFDVEIEATNTQINKTVTYRQTQNEEIPPHSSYPALIYLTIEEADELLYTLAHNTQHQVTIRVTNVINENGVAEEDLTNNEITQSTKLLDIWNKEDLTIRYKTNLYPSYYNLRILDGEGYEIKRFYGSGTNSIYEYKLNDLPDGCYTFEVECKDLSSGRDIYYGLYVPAVFGNIGRGEFGFYGAGTSKVFNPEFGRFLRYSFVLNRFTEIEEEEKIDISVYPNPAASILFIQTYQNMPNAKIDIYDINGNIVFSKSQNISENNKTELDISALITGSYQIRISNDKKTTWTKFIKE